MNLERLYADIKDSRAGEGFCGSVYPDRMNIPTIGYGRNLHANPLTTDEASVLLTNDVYRVIGLLRQFLPWVLDLDDVRCRAFTELAFNMGIRGLLTFTKALAAAQSEDWHVCHAELLDSQWAKQVQAARRDRIASMVLTGDEL